MNCLVSLSNSNLLSSLGWSVVFCLTLFPSVCCTFAATTTFSDRILYQAELGTIVIDDYENPNYEYLQYDTEMSSVLGETAYTTTGWSNTNIVREESGNHVYCAGCNGSFEMDFSNTSLSEGDGVFGVGFDFFNNDSSFLYSAFITFGDNSTVNIQLPHVVFDDTLFFGVVSDSLVKSIHLGLSGGSYTRSGSFGIDNLTIGNPVPEPNMLFLFCLAGMFLGSRRRR